MNAICNEGFESRFLNVIDLLIKVRVYNLRAILCQK